MPFLKSISLQPRFLTLLLLAALLLCLVPGAAAQNPLILSVAVPSFFRDTLDDALITDFENANPGVQVEVVGSSTFGVATAASNLDTHLNSVRDYVSSADVVYVSSASSFISPEATQAGYYLNLGPIAGLDLDLNTPDFFPAAWQAFQWDQGVWALPVSTDIVFMTYDPAAFDRAGLSYPTPQWTLFEYENAIRALAQRDAAGAVTTPGLTLDNNYIAAIFFRSLLPQGLYDPNAIPNTPSFSRPDTTTLVETWFELQREGLVTLGVNPESPLRLGTAIDLVQLTTETLPYEGVLLSGGLGGMDVQAFAVSAGTLYPEQAYALARFLTTRADVAEAFGQNPARQSLAAENAGGGFGFNLPDDVRQIVTDGLFNGLSPAELRFFDYVTVVFERMTLRQLDAVTALGEVETEAIAAQTTAAERRATDVITVSPPNAQVVLASGEIALEFGYASFATPLPNQDKWDAAIADFVAADPQVGAVNFDVGFGAFGLEGASEQYDCFYLPFNAVPGADLARLLSLDPFLNADPTFSQTDLVGNTLAQVQRDGRTYAMPITVEPDILRYNPAPFNQVAAPLPVAGWTVDDFINAVQLIKLNPEDPAPFTGSSTGGNDLLILIAAYGGLPLDTRSSPPIYDYTNPANVAAIQQVLDLARDGYVRYDRRLGDFINAFNFGPSDTPDTALYADTLSILNFAGLLDDEETEGEPEVSPYVPTTYPRGAQYSAGSYTIGTAYISANTQNPEACYGFISQIARTPDLFTAMPARRSLINDPTTIATQGEDLVALYNEIDRIMADPTTIILPSLFDAATAPQGFVAQLWLFQAFDTYVLDDGDLEAALRDAQNYAVTFQQCIDLLPPLDNSNQEAQQEYFRGFLQCAGQVDPRLQPLLNLIGGGD